MRVLALLLSVVCVIGLGQSRAQTMTILRLSEATPFTRADAKLSDRPDTLAAGTLVRLISEGSLELVVGLDEATTGFISVAHTSEALRMCVSSLGDTKVDGGGSLGRLSEPIGPTMPPGDYGPIARQVDLTPDLEVWSSGPSLIPRRFSEHPEGVIVGPWGTDSRGAFEALDFDDLDALDTVVFRAIEAKRAEPDAWQRAEELYGMAKENKMSWVEFRTLNSLVNSSPLVRDELEDLFGGVVSDASKPDFKAFLKHERSDSKLLDALKDYRLGRKDLHSLAAGHTELWLEFKKTRALVNRESQVRTELMSKFGTVADASPIVGFEALVEQQAHDVETLDSLRAFRTETENKASEK